MAQVDFIPGPWTVEPREECSGFRLYDADGDLIDYLPDTRWIDEGDDPEMVASVHLIAAAPEMFEALVHVRENLGDPVPIGRKHVARIVDAALAKARGDQVSA